MIFRVSHMVSRLLDCHGSILDKFKEGHDARKVKKHTSNLLLKKL